MWCRAVTFPCSYCGETSVKEKMSCHDLNLLRDQVITYSTQHVQPTCMPSHRTLQDIGDDPQPMGGLVVLLAGDFRQTLPVVTRGTPADELNACLKSFHLWSHIVKMHLTVNMRVQLHNDTTAAEFADELLKIGEGKLETDSEGDIQFSNTF
ncbi:hypothetical protein LAZ67_8000372 [Cordylochernes scorpioides]|uniref:ATP-dependent DNA helicase n=1 Tax=Cordylochernes scorpioides TaxID=51811 RepID=A0ABY6KPB7_9ARAC|nr:hypothetical protein LAZ67_8000372 [Cordylochernes scorpioides]